MLNVLEKACVGPMNHEERVEWYFDNKAKNIDPMTAWLELGIYRLAAVIHKMRGRGFTITTQDLAVSSQFGDKAVVANYVFVSKPTKAG